MINFTVGPVQSDEEVLKIGAEQVPYFRTEEFSKLMLENEALIKEFADASEKDRVVFLTGSGTAAMESAIINTLTEKDKALVVNGGSFGERFVQLLTLHGIPFTEIKLEPGKALTANILEKYNPKDYTSFVINLHETSTGVLYDLDLISAFCSKNNLFLIVDAISAFLADDISFKDKKIDVMITGSQKALACPPGVSLLILSERAQQRIEKNDSKVMYLDLKLALKNGERGQTPFTPAVGTLIQINKRLLKIKASGGAKAEVERVRELAKYFRKKVKSFPFEFVTDSPSNAVTSLKTIDVNAYEIFLELKDHYDIWICPNGGEMKETIFRVGHIGNLTKKDYDKLIEAFASLKANGVI